MKKLITISAALAAILLISTPAFAIQTWLYSASTQCMPQDEAAMDVLEFQTRNADWQSSNDVVICPIPYVDDGGSIFDLLVTLYVDDDNAGSNMVCAMYSRDSNGNLDLFAMDISAGSNSTMTFEFEDMNNGDYAYLYCNLIEDVSIGAYSVTYGDF